MAECWYVRAVVSTLGNQKKAHKIMKKLEKLLDSEDVDIGALIVGVSQPDGDSIRVMLYEEEEDLVAKGVPEGIL